MMSTWIANTLYFIIQDRDNGVEEITKLEFEYKTLNLQIIRLSISPRLLRESTVD